LRAWLDVFLNSHSAGLIGLGIICVIGGTLFSFAPRKV